MEFKNIFEYEYKYNYIETFLYGTLAFLIPLFFGHPQVVVGTVINALLIVSALNLKWYKVMPIILLPSLGALTRGALFGPFTMFLVYMIPFIWIGNSILVLVFKKLKLNYFFTLVIGAGLKALFLFLSAVVLFKLNLVPVIFLTAMGIMQFITALSGGVVAYGMHLTRKAVYNKRF